VRTLLVGPHPIRRGTGERSRSFEKNQAEFVSQREVMNSGDLILQKIINKTEDIICMSCNSG
jgi:hypothetical protein